MSRYCFNFVVSTSCTLLGNYFNIWKEWGVTNSHKNGWPKAFHVTVRRRSVTSRQRATARDGPKYYCASATCYGKGEVPDQVCNRTDSTSSVLDETKASIYYPPTVILCKKYEHIMNVVVSVENFFRSLGLHHQSVPSETDWCWIRGRLVRYRNLTPES